MTSPLVGLDLVEPTAGRLTELRQLLQVVASSGSLHTALEQVVRWIEAVQPGAAACVMLLDEEGRTMSPVGAVSLPAEYLAAAQRCPVAHGTGSCGAAILTGRAVICEDIATDPRWGTNAPLPVGAGLLSVCSLPIFSSTGRPLGSFAVYRRERRAPAPAELRLLEDAAPVVALVIERAQADAERAAMERRLRTVTEHATAGICLYDADGACTYANPTWCAIAGRTAADLGGHRWLDALHALDRAQVVSRWAHARECHAPVQLRYRLIHPDGAVRWVDHAFAPLGTREAPQGFVGTITDRTDAVQSEAALLESERRFKRMAECSPQIVYLFDIVARRTLYINREPLAAIGYTPELIEELGDEFMLRLVHPDDQGIIADHFARIGQLPDGTAVECTYRIHTRDGRERRMTSRDVVFSRAADGTPRVILGLAEDVTERLEVEHRARQTERLTALGTLTGGVAHDFNNILAIIQGNLELLREGRDSAGAAVDAAQSLETALAATLRARTLVRQILAFSRQEPGGERVPIEVRALLDETYRFLRASLPTTIALRIECPQAPGCTIVGDATRLQQVLLNLAANAEHALRGRAHGHITIRFLCAQLDEAAAGALGLAAGRYGQLDVRDDGAGMPAEVAARVFEPFFTTKAPGEGTGMGLAVAHGTIAAHGGAMTVSSEPGVGTCFSIYLPCVAVEAPAASAPERPQEGLRGRVLLVDDERDLVLVQARLLRRLGLEADVLQDPTEALARVQAEPGRYDLVITDQTMPSLTGDALARAIRAVRPDLPIILCTGYAPAKVEASIADLGIEACLEKPVTLDELSRTVQQVLAAAAKSG